MLLDMWRSEQESLLRRQDFHMHTGLTALGNAQTYSLEMPEAPQMLLMLEGYGGLGQTYLAAQLPVPCSVQAAVRQCCPHAASDAPSDAVAEWTRISRFHCLRYDHAGGRCCTARGVSILLLHLHKLLQNWLQNWLWGCVQHWGCLCSEHRPLSQKAAGRSLSSRQAKPVIAHLRMSG